MSTYRSYDGLLGKKLKLDDIVYFGGDSDYVVKQGGTSYTYYLYNNRGQNHQVLLDIGFVDKVHVYNLSKQVYNYLHNGTGMYFPNAKNFEDLTLLTLVIYKLVEGYGCKHYQIRNETCRSIHESDWSSLIKMVKTDHLMNTSVIGFAPTMADFGPRGDYSYADTSYITTMAQAKGRPLRDSPGTIRVDELFTDSYKLPNQSTMQNTYKSYEDLLGKTLNHNDIIDFGTACYRLAVMGTHLSCIMGSNDSVLKKFGMSDKDQSIFGKAVYGHEVKEEPNSFPETKANNFKGLTLMALVIYRLNKLYSEASPILTDAILTGNWWRIIEEVRMQDFIQSISDIVPKSKPKIETMSTYKSYKELLGNTLKKCDVIVFDDLQYNYEYSDHLTCQRGGNDSIFIHLGLDNTNKAYLASAIFGVSRTSDGFPEYYGSYQAEKLTLFALVLFKLLDYHKCGILTGANAMRNNDWSNIVENIKKQREHYLEYLIPKPIPSGAQSTPTIGEFINKQTNQNVNGNIIIVPAKTPVISVGERITGSAVHGRNSKSTIAIRHLSYNQISS